MNIEEIMQELAPFFVWTLFMPEAFRSVFYGRICLTPKHYYMLASEGNERLELVVWLWRN